MTTKGSAERSGGSGVRGSDDDDDDDDDEEECDCIKLSDTRDRREHTTQRERCKAIRHTRLGYTKVTLRLRLDYAKATLRLR